MGFGIGVDSESFKIDCTGFNDSMPPFVKGLMENLTAMSQDEGIEKLFL